MLTSGYKKVESEIEIILKRTDSEEVKKDFKEFKRLNTGEVQALSPELSRKYYIKLYIVANLYCILYI